MNTERRIESEEGQIALSCRFPAALVRELRSLSIKLERPLAWVIRRAVDRYLAEEGRHS